MKFSRNLLLKEKKSLSMIIYGAVVVILSLSWVYVHYKETAPIGLFNWLYFVVFLLLGTTYLAEGLGISTANLLGGKAFIEINDEQIVIKPDILKKAQRVKWSEIKTIEYKAAQYKITKTDGNTVILELPTMNYNLVQEIKEAVNKMASLKNLLQP